MVTDSRKAQGTDSLRYLNLPVGIEVDSGPDGSPRAVYVGRRRQKLQVISIQDVWRIDDEWWQPSPIHRSYYQVLLENGQRLAVFRDDTDSSWFYQRS